MTNTASIERAFATITQMPKGQEEGLIDHRLHILDGPCPQPRNAYKDDWLKALGSPPTEVGLRISDEDTPCFTIHQ